MEKLVPVCSLIKKCSKCFTYHALGSGAGVSWVVRVRVGESTGVGGVVVREGQRLAGVHLLAEA